MKTYLKRIEAIKDALAKNRDDLRELMSEMEDLDGATTRGIESLEEAVDALSELV